MPNLGHCLVGTNVSMFPGKKKSVESAIVETAKEFSENSTVHGVWYILNPSSALTDRLVWFCLVCLSLSLAGYLSFTAYGDWQTSLVSTTLTDTTKQVSQLPFPAVTICTEGLNMDAVNKALANDFMLWREYQDLQSSTLEEELQQFLENKFGVSPDSGITIQDIISALSSPQVDQSVATNGMVNDLACQNRAKEVTTNRRKRSVCKSPYYPHETDCQKFYQCSNGNGIEKKCSNGLVWDQLLYTCKRGKGPFIYYVIT